MYVVAVVVVAAILWSWIRPADERNKIIAQVIREQEAQRALPGRHTRWINMERGLSYAGQYRRSGAGYRFISR